MFGPCDSFPLPKAAGFWTMWCMDMGYKATDLLYSIKTDSLWSRTLVPHEWCHANPVVSFLSHHLSPAFELNVPERSDTPFFYCVRGFEPDREGIYYTRGEPIWFNHCKNCANVLVNHLDTSTFRFLQTFFCGWLQKFQVETSQKGQGVITVFQSGLRWDASLSPINLVTEET